MGERVEDVGDGDDPPAKRNRLPRQAVLMPEGMSLESPLALVMLGALGKLSRFDL